MYKEMKVVNKTRLTTITYNLVIATSLKKKMTGLLDNRYDAFYLKTHFGIHTMGMKKAIDVVILNKKHEVVVLKHNLKPWTLFFWNIKYEDVLELPVGTISKSKTRLGDILAIENN